MVLLALHGLVHFLGVAKGFGLAEVPQLTQPISRLGGLGWLAAGLAILLTASLLGGSSPMWLWVAPVAAVLSQAMIVSSWSDAKYGTLVNVILVIAGAWAFMSVRPLAPAADHPSELDRRAITTRPSTIVRESSDACNELDLPGLAQEPSEGARPV